MEKPSVFGMTAFAQTVLALAPRNGINRTTIPFLTIRKDEKPTVVDSRILTPCICLLVQGEKRMVIANETLKCRPGDFIFSTVDMPVKGQVSAATAEVPYLAICIEFAQKEIEDVAREAEFRVDPNAHASPGAFIQGGNADLVELFWRMLRLAQSRTGGSYPARLLKNELVYRMITGEAGTLFYQSAIFTGNRGGIGKAIEWIKKRYSETITIGEIAKVSIMSPSALFTKFKAVTSLSPLQYQKLLRLQEARRLLMNGKRNVSGVSAEVGYASPSQFNREYKRLFGKPPLEDSRLARAGLQASAVPVRKFGT